VIEHVHRFECLGTTVTIVIGHDGRDTFGAGLLALRVQARLRSLHRTLTRFDPESELCGLNTRAGDEVAVSRDLLTAVAAARTAAAGSDGLVDPTVLPELERAGYAESRLGRRPARLADALAVAPPRTPAAPRRDCRWQQIVIDPSRRTVRLPRGVRIDLGGTAKGLAVDIAAGMLAGERAYAVDAGGDLRVGGTHPPAREIRIDHPLRARTAPFELTEGSVATSGPANRVWRTAAGYAHHLIDPGRGRPAWTGILQATALAPTTVEAEVLAKMALLRGPAAGIEVLERHGGAVVLDDGAVVAVAGARRPPVVTGRRPRG
jgi:thiamine biosynthesis lipoprotein